MVTRRPRYADSVSSCIGVLQRGQSTGRHYRSSCSKRSNRLAFVAGRILHGSGDWHADAVDAAADRLPRGDGRWNARLRVVWRNAAGDGDYRRMLEAAPDFSSGNTMVVPVTRLASLRRLRTF